MFGITGPQNWHKCYGTLVGQTYDDDWDLYFMYMLPSKEGSVVFVLKIAAVSSYLCAKVMSGFERSLSKDGKALTLKEIKLIPSLPHALSHGLVLLSHFFMLYYYRMEAMDRSSEVARPKTYPIIRSALHLESPH